MTEPTSQAEPADADTEQAQGVVLSRQGLHAEAEARYRRALALAPDNVNTLNNLAASLMAQNQGAAAEAMFRRALELDPAYAPALANLGVLFKNRGRTAEAKALLTRGFEAEPTLEAALQAYLALSPMACSAAHQAADRASYAEGLEALAADPRTFGYAGEPLQLPWYYLAYHARDDRQLLERTAEVLRGKVAGLDHVAPGLQVWRGPRAEGRRLRVAFCSEFFHAHTIGRLYQGFIRHLDRSRFEVVVLQSRAAAGDAARAELDGLAGNVIDLPQDANGQRAVIGATAPDVLFYPEVGMSSAIWALANARLAPVQATSWGHPNTSGLPSLDYFVSSDRIEPAGAEARYSERLVLLSRLPCCYDAPPAAEAAPRAALRLPHEGVLYGCPQTLFKFHPDFDRVLAEIAVGDPTGHIVLIGAHIAAWTEVLKARWAERHPILNERVMFLPRLTHAGFMAHLAHIDVLLDPVHFGSGNTLYEGLAMGTPIVTWRGHFMRGAIVAGAYEQMGIADAPVARELDDYAPLALGLGRDAARRARLRAELQARSRLGLYGDLTAVREFEAFLEAAVEASTRGERLPSGWRPDLAAAA